jgi:acyl dehydratase
VAHGAYLIALASRFVGVYLPGRDALLLAVSMSFLAPVLEGTRIIVSGVVDQMSEGVRSIVLKLTVVEATNATPLARGRLTIGFTKAVPSEGAA